MRFRRDARRHHHRRSYVPRDVRQQQLVTVNLLATDCPCCCCRAASCPFGKPRRPLYQEQRLTNEFLDSLKKKIESLRETRHGLLLFPTRNVERNKFLLIKNVPNTTLYHTHTHTRNIHIQIWPKTDLGKNFREKNFYEFNVERG